MLWKRKLCEVQLAAQLKETAVERIDSVFMDIAKSLFECIKRDADSWAGNRLIIKTLDIYTARGQERAFKPPFLTQDVTSIRESNIHDMTLHDLSFYDSLYEEIEGLKSVADKDFKIDSPSWAQIVYHLLVKYCFATTVDRDTILIALTFAFNARICEFMESVRFAEEKLACVKSVEDCFIVPSYVALADEQRFS